MEKLLSLQNHLPTPTKEDPHRQLDWIFRNKISLYSNKQTQANFATALSFYKRFLKHTHNYSAALERDPRFCLKQEWDVFALHKVKQWIDATNIADSEDYLTSHSLRNIVSALRQTMEHAYEHLYIEKPVINVTMPTAVRETDSHTAYSLEECERIFKVLGPLIKFSKDLLAPYVPTGVGKDPRNIDKAKLARERRIIGESWRCWAPTDKANILAPREDNLRWYFENVMNCVPLPSVRENSRHMSFFQTAKIIHGGLKKLYRNWGVSSFIDSDVMVPLLVEVISETGLNVESALSLRRDCFKEAHPLSGLPFLEYEKPRSGGEKELHITLFDKDYRNPMGLKQRQSRIIANSITTIQKLTEPLAKQASEEVGKYLFIFQPRGRTNTGGLGQVKRMTTRIALGWTARIMKQHHLRADNGDPMSFTLSRFRPTKITEMVAQGFDFFDIMAIAGHSSITTTLSYIDRLKWTSDFHHRIERALNTIRRNKQEYQRKPLPVAITRDAAPGEFIFKAPVCHCKDPYDPPKVVRNSHNYQEGDACTYFNMCLSCDNVLVTEMNLPRLISYRSDIEHALANLSEIPRQGELYKKIKMILDQILTPGILFSKETLDWAAQLALVADFEVLDSFISRSEEIQ